MSDAPHIPLPPDADALLGALATRAGGAAVVGGAVRDALLGREVRDLDVVVGADVTAVRDACADQSWCRTIYAVGERYGTLGVVLADGTVVEVSSVRAADIEHDLAHRDFTVNAMAMSWPSRVLIDPTGGTADLVNRVLRAPGEPAERFAEDPLRVLRAARFVAELGFSVEPATLSAARAAAPLLTGVAPERVRDELSRLLMGTHAADGLRTALRTGALAVVLPEVAALDEVSQPSFHDLDVFEHTLQTVDAVPARLELRWAALLHDVGKAPCRTVEPGGRIRFFRHAKTGAEMTAAICERLRFSKAMSRAIVHLVAEHMRLGELDTDNARAVDRAVRRLDLWASSAPDAARLTSAEDALELTMADFAATAHRAEAPEVRARLERAIAAARSRAGSLPVASPLSGRDIMRELGVAEGPGVGAALEAVEDAIDRGAIAPDDRAAALEVARDAVSRSR